MAAGPLSIKLRCASWQQLSTIYKRDLSKGTMFLKAATPPALGTAVRIDLTLPSASVIVLHGVVEQHVTDPLRGAGVELKLAPIPAGSVWMIESALASETKRRNTTGIPVVNPGGVVPVSGPSGTTGMIPTLSDSQDVVAAEQDLVKALQSEAESLKKLNPFLVLGVGYEASDSDVRAAFGELTKRYHPDLFARYESQELRAVAAEIFILIRDAYRKLGDEVSRQQSLGALGRAAAPRPVPVRAPTPPPVPVKPPPRPTGALPIVAPPPVARPFTDVADTVRPGEHGGGLPSAPPESAPPSVAAGSADPTSRLTTPSRGLPALSSRLPAGGQPATTSPALAPTQRAEKSQQIPKVAESSGSLPPMRESQAIPTLNRTSTAPPPMIPGGDGESSELDELIDAGKYDEALAAYRLSAKKNPSDRSFRAGIELCEGLRSLAARDRLEAAQRFEAALEIDPSNERAARELAEMRRLATNERKGLLTRLMGKREP